MKLNQLTFLRFVAAIVVVIFHYGGKTWIGRISPALRSGPVMVTFFFVLSGFIMAIAYGKSDKIKKGKYWVARFARIAPVYYVALIMTFIAFYLSMKIVSPIPSALHIFFLQAWFPHYALSLNGPAWSLSVEMFFYLIFPFLLPILKKNSLFKSCALTLIFWALSMFILSTLQFSPSFKYQGTNVLHSIVFYFPVAHLSSFLLGVVGGLFYNNFLSRQKIAPLISASLVLFTFTVSVLFLHYHAQIVVLRRIDYAYGVLSPVFLALILSLSIDRSWLSRILSSKLLVFLGELGYSIYILQYPIRTLYARYIIPLLNITGSQHFYLYLLLLIVLSAVIYTSVEKPMRYNLRQAADRWFVKLQAQPSEQI